MFFGGGKKGGRLSTTQKLKVSGVNTSSLGKSSSGQFPGSRQYGESVVGLESASAFLFSVVCEPEIVSIKSCLDLMFVLQSILQSPGRPTLEIFFGCFVSQN